MKKRLLVICAAVTMTASASRAADNKVFGVDLTLGLPNLGNVQLSYLGLSKFAFGVGFGTLPINSLIANNVTLPSSIAVDANYSIIPSASYSLLAANIFARFYPLDSGLFLQLSYVNVTFRANVNGTLRNNSSGATSSGAISGSASVNQGVANFMVGYEKRFNFGLFLAASLGAGYYLSPGSSIHIGGSAANFAGVSGSQAAFDDASNQVTAAFNEAIRDYDAAIAVLPSLLFTFGWAF